MQKTPLYEEHGASGGKVVDFHGWALPVQYAGILQEHAHTREHASIFDCSHMGEFVIQGAEAIAAYDALVINDVTKLKIGRGRYGAFLNDDAGIIDDVITMRLTEDELYIVTNAGPLEDVAALLSAHVPGVRNVSGATAKIDVQGPLARDVLSALGLDGASDLKYFGVASMSWRDSDIVVSRTGYTGELGYELFMPNELAVPMWRALLAIESVKPAALGARDTLRTEVGYGLSGQDFDSSRTPLEASMDVFIAWDSDFRGKAALAAQRERGDHSVLRGIRTADRRAPRHDFAVYAGEEKVGVVTSGTFGPSVGHGIGLAYLPQSLRVPGARLVAGPKALEIETAELPFYTKGTCRA